MGRESNIGRGRVTGCRTAYVPGVASLSPQDSRGWASGSTRSASAEVSSRAVAKATLKGTAANASRKPDAGGSEYAGFVPETTATP